jgi:hypothetical protein
MAYRALYGGERLFWGRGLQNDPIVRDAYLLEHTRSSARSAMMGFLKGQNGGVGPGMLAWYILFCILATD